MEKYDVAIIGGGPGGVAAGIYAARKKLSAVIVTDTFGGQSLVSAEIQNWIGTPAISGFDLARQLEGHLRAQEGIVIKDNDLVTRIEEKGSGKELRFVCTTREGSVFEAKAVLLAMGSRRKRLGVPGEDRFEGHGVVYCSICDAPLFKGKRVAVVGGGNSALESVVDLLPYASDITLVHHGSTLKGDPVTIEKIGKHENVHIIYQAETQEVRGDKNVEELVYLDRVANVPRSLRVEGVFVEIGIVPNSELVASLVERTAWGAVVVDHATQRTSRTGLWAAGDVTNGLYKQNNISVGESVTALLNINDYLHGL